MLKEEDLDSDMEMNDEELLAMMRQMTQDEWICSQIAINQ